MSDHGPGPGGPPAGWYPDPEYPGQQRYWDGQRWTEHRAPTAGSSSPQWGVGQPAHTSSAVQQEQNQKALWSMILGILGLVCCWLVTSIPAIVLGHMAKQEIAASGGRQGGQGMAQAGFIMGIIGTALGVLGLIWFVFVLAVGAGSGFETNFQTGLGL